jgi:Xaa-Pro aminopeptidase
MSESVIPSRAPHAIRPLHPRNILQLSSVLCASVLVAPPLAAQSDVAFPKEVYAERRARLVERLQAPIIVPGEYMIRHGGTKKQDLDFAYLTGVESPYAILVLAPAPAGGADGMREVLFLPEEFQFAGAQYSFPDARLRDAAWNRTIRRLSPGAAAQEVTGVPESYGVDSFAEEIAGIVGDADAVYLTRDGGSLYAPPGMAPPLSVRRQFEDALVELLPGQTIKDASPTIRRMRLVKDAYEIAALRRAADISVEGLLEAMGRIRPGANDLEIAGAMEWVWKREGSPRASFGPIVASGEDAVSLYTLRSENYNAVDRVMQDGEMVFIDYGAAEWDMYTSDLCRTYPVSGRFSDRQRELYEIVLEAQRAAIALVRPGVMMTEVIKAAAAVFKAHGLQSFEDIDEMGADHVWGLMPSPTYWVDGPARLTDYSGARASGVRDLGHHIGLDALDSRDYTMPLEPGMVFTVEPKIYVPELGLAIMIEDMILVTEDGHENLSARAPRSVEDIERVMGGR